MFSVKQYVIFTAEKYVASRGGQYIVFNVVFCISSDAKQHFVCVGRYAMFSVGQ